MQTVSYFKRFRMDIRLADIPAVETPVGMHWIAWRAELVDVHAQVLYDSFHQEIDSIVFPGLGNQLGCQILMREIAAKAFFIPQATWLLAGPDGVARGSIQGLQESGRGAIQNVGVVPEFRGLGLGRALVLRALHGFRQLGLGVASLEATAENERAVRLYRSLGFRKARILYKPVTQTESVPGALEESRDWMEPHE